MRIYSTISAHLVIYGKQQSSLAKHIFHSDNTIPYSWLPRNASGDNDNVRTSERLGESLIGRQVTHNLRRRRNMGKVRRYTRSVHNIVQCKLLDYRVSLEQQGQRLANAACTRQVRDDTFYLSTTFEVIDEGGYGPAAPRTQALTIVR